MTVAIGLFGGSFLVLYLLDRATGFGKAWFKEYRGFARYHAALLFSSALLSDRLLSRPSPDLIYSLYTAAAVVGLIWAGILGQAQQKRDQ